MINELKFNHFGLAVKDSKKSQKFFYMHGYALIKDVIDENQNIKASLIRKEKQFDIEIISKINNNDKTPIDTLIQDNRSAIYHICYECKNIDKLIDDFKKENIWFKNVVKRMHSPLFDKDVSFYVTDSVGVIEIIHI